MGLPWFPFISIYVHSFPFRPCFNRIVKLATFPLDSDFNNIETFIKCITFFLLHHATVQEVVMIVYSQDDRFLLLLEA